MGERVPSPICAECLLSRSGPKRTAAYLCRDRLGIKPLYIYQRGQDLYFGSELKTLFVHHEIERRVDLDGLNLYLSLNYIPGPCTLVEGIRKLPPGHWLEWKDGQIATGPLVDPEVQSRVHFARRSQARTRLATEGLRRGAHDFGCTSRRMVEWWTGLLGRCPLRRPAAPALKTFSVSFRGRNFDESR